MWHNEGMKIPNEEDRVTLDFKQEFYLAFELDRNLMKQFSRGVPIKIWRRIPIKKEKPRTDEKAPIEYIFEHKEEQLGFSILSLQPLLKNNTQVEMSERLPLFEYKQDALRYYNVFWPHKEEQARIAKYSAEIEKSRVEKYTKKPEEEDNTKKDPKAQAKKPDPKKKKPAAPGGKKPVEEEIKIAVPTFEVNKRNTICYSEDLIARDGVGNYKDTESKFLVAGSSLLAVKVRIF